MSLPKIRCRPDKCDMCGIRERAYLDGRLHTHHTDGQLPTCMCMGDETMRPDTKDNSRPRSPTPHAARGTRHAARGTRHADRGPRTADRGAARRSAFLRRLTCVGSVPQTCSSRCPCWQTTSADLDCAWQLVDRPPVLAGRDGPSRPSRPHVPWRNRPDGIQCIVGIISRAVL